MKEEVSVRLISNMSELPDMSSKNFFHSIEFFRILEATPRQKPCMAVAMDKYGHVVGHMLTNIFFHRSILPPFIYSHGRVYGEGEYDSESLRSKLFPKFLQAVTKRFDHHLCLYIEFSHMTSKMSWYGTFRSNGYFPVQWQEIHNSLHSMEPSQRLSDKTKQQIAEAERRGTRHIEIESDGTDLQQTVRLLKHHFWLKPRRSIPDAEMFRHLAYSANSHIFATKYHNRVIGACVCIVTGGNAYMWHLAARRKSYISLHPDTYTVWTALQTCYAEGLRHMYFLDAGIPFKKSPMRDFILSFGGMPVAKFRWFRFPISWLNRVCDWIFNE